MILIRVGLVRNILKLSYEISFEQFGWNLNSNINMKVSYASVVK